MEVSRGAPRAPRKRHLAFGLAVVAALAGLVVLVVILLGSDDDPAEPSPGSAATTTASSTEATGLAEELTTEQQVDQVLLLGFEGTDATAPLMADLRERQIGGVLIGPQNWFGADQGAALADAVREAGSIGGEVPPLVVAAQEGGRYRSFADLPPEQTELEVADEGSVEVAEEWSRTAGEALGDAGFDLNLFPVADVATLDSPIADRAFSDDPLFAAQLTAATVRGCRAARIACAALHFPGLGAASQDTSDGPATVSLDAAGLAARDLEPFRAAFAERIPAVVLSLAFYAGYDPITPGALTEAVATGLLRDELGFEGVAITDDLGSGAIRAGRSVRQAAVEAIAAGADMVQIGSAEDQRGVREALLEAVADGTLPPERLTEAADRVLELKRAQGLLSAPVE
jgi:beta-N-acetylhexosaminidase